MRPGRKFFLMLLIVGFVLLGCALWMMGRQGGERSLPGRPLTNDDVYVGGVHFTEWKGGDLQWTLDADSCTYDNGKEEAALRGVRAVFSPPSGGKMILSADTAVYQKASGDLVARGNVRGESLAGYQFFTTGLTYNVRTRVVLTEHKVTLKKDRLTIEGTGMRGSLSDQEFVLLSSVRARVSPEDIVP